MGFCTRCGAPLQADASFCTVCGTKIVSASQARQETTQPPEPPVQPDRPEYTGSQPQQSYTGSYPPVRPVYPTYRQPGNDWGRNDPPPRKHPVKKYMKYKSALRFISFFFALGLLAVFVGLGSGIYYNRSVDQSLKSYIENANTTEEISARQKEHFSAMIAAVMTRDVKQYLIESEEFVVGTSDASSVNRMNAAELEPYRTAMDETVRAGQAKYGIQWTILEIGLRSRLLIIIGGILAAVLLIPWLALGGRLSNLSRTAITPLLAMFIIWGVCMIILALVIPAVDIGAIETADETVPGLLAAVSWLS